MKSSIKEAIGFEPVFTNYAKQYDKELFKGTLDYIFVSKNISVNRAYKLVSYTNIKKLKSLPSKYNSSDHIPLMVNINL